jgi:hypothetical protein
MQTHSSTGLAGREARRTAPRASAESLRGFNGTDSSAGRPLRVSQLRQTSPHAVALGAPCDLRVPAHRGLRLSQADPAQAIGSSACPMTGGFRHRPAHRPRPGLASRSRCSGPTHPPFPWSASARRRRVVGARHLIRAAAGTTILASRRCASETGPQDDGCVRRCRLGGVQHRHARIQRLLLPDVRERGEPGRIWQASRSVEPDDGPLISALPAPPGLAPCRTTSSSTPRAGVG